MPTDKTLCNARRGKLGDGPRCINHGKAEYKGPCHEPTHSQCRAVKTDGKVCKAPQAEGQDRCFQNQDGHQTNQMDAMTARMGKVTIETKETKKDGAKVETTQKKITMTRKNEKGNERDNNKGKARKA